MSTERQDDRLRNYLQKVSSEYDFVIIDNPPAVSMCVINALCATNDVIIPVVYLFKDVGGSSGLQEAMQRISGNITERTERKWQHSTSWIY